MTNKDISAAYIGSEQVDKIYLGEDLVYGGEAPEPIYSAMPLTFEVISAGTINFRRINSQSTTPARSVSYSKDGGATWTTFTTTTGTTNAIQVQPGDKVQFKGLNNSYASSASNYNTFFGSPTYASTATVKVYGNIMSLVRGDDFTTATTLYGSINSMFRNAGDKLVDASHLILPATTLYLRSYSYMFYGCTSLTTAPALPATALTQQCYSYMFDGCTSLTTAPELPATTLVTSCYERMFQNCTNLNYINCHAVIPNDAYTNYWVNGVAATGTFVKNPDSNWARSVSGIPSGWTVQDYVDPASIPVLKIAGQSITRTSESSGVYEWHNLDQYSGTSFTIEANGVPITADTWDYYEYYIDECGEPSEITYETGTTRSVFEANSGYISVAAYFSSNNRVVYESADDNTSDDPEVICGCHGGCWDGETCQKCASEDPCDDWEGNGYSSYEDCTCAEHGEGCEEPSDPCDDWEGNGYSSWEECTCAERGENCPEEESGE